MADGTRIEELKRRVQLDPASIAFAALAEEYRRAGQYEESMATCLAGLQRHPAYLSARVTLGRSLLELGRYEEAREQLEHVLRAAPENLAAIRGLAEIHHRVGNMAETHDPAVHAGDAAVPPAPERPAVTPAQPPPASPIEAPAPAEPAAVPASPSTPRPGPIKVQLSKLAEPEPVSGSALPSTPEMSSIVDAPRGTPDVVHAAPATGAVLDTAVTPPPTARIHPDAAALPALEAMLAAILRARDTIGPDTRSGR
jgi:tetratricopeptide (TPR) repeat protein